MAKGASESTVKANRSFMHQTELDWNDRTDFELAKQDCVDPAPDLEILDEDGNTVWNGKAYDTFLKGEPPETVNPSLWRQALLSNHRGLFKINESIFQVRGHALANMTVVLGESGYIVIDPNNTVEVAKWAMNLLKAHVGDKPIKAIIYSHTHSDHWGGVKGLVSASEVARGKTRIIASKGFVEFVVAEFLVSSEGLNPRNCYMYGETLSKSPIGHVDCGLGKATEGGTITLIPPTDIVPEEGCRMVVDGVEMVFQYAPGEAPTGLHVYFPQLKTLFMADNCYASLHNVYTIRGAYTRNAVQWADSIHRALDFNNVEVMLGAHHWPRFGRERIQDYLGAQRDALKYLHDQTLRLMNHGFSGAEIADRIELPDELARLWHLRGYYGMIKHNVRGIYDFYLGWYDGNPANLDPLPVRESASKLIEYMGGIDKVITRAKNDYESGNYRWVVQILDYVLWAQPENKEALKLASKAHSQLGYQSENATWRNAYLTAAQEMTTGLPKHSQPIRNGNDVIHALPIKNCFDFLGIRLNGPKASGLEIIVNWTLVDTGEQYQTRLKNSVLFCESGHSKHAQIAVNWNVGELKRWILGKSDISPASGTKSLSVKGKLSIWKQFINLFDRFDPWFPIASRGLKHGEQH